MDLKAEELEGLHFVEQMQPLVLLQDVLLQDVPWLLGQLPMHLVGIEVVWKLLDSW